MNIKNKLILFISMLILLTMVTATPTSAVDHEEFAENEAKYKNMCLVNVSLDNTEVCGEFQKYLNAKIANQKNEIDQLSEQIEDVKSNIVEHTKKLNEYEMEIEQLEIDIQLLDDSIAEMEANIEKLELSIIEKQAEVDAIDELVKNRMQSTLSGYYVSDHISFLFGASNFAQFIQRAEILNTISEYDKLQMEELEQLRDDLNREKVALEQQKVAVEENLENVKLAKQSKEKLQKATKDLVIRFRQEEVKLMEANDQIAQEIKLTQAEQTKVQNSIKEAIRKEEARKAEEERKRREEEERRKQEEQNQQNQNNSGGNNTGSTGSDSEDVTNATGNWLYPAASGFRISAGAWFYPSSFSSAPHWGVDLAAPVGHRLQAVQPGIVVQAQRGCSVYGYLGNSCNYGSGNNVQVVHAVNGKLYRTWYGHMSTVDVSVGQYVQRGQKLGTVGSSGNSSGPHLHYEVHLIGHGTLESFRGNIPFIPRVLSNRCENNGNTPPCYIKPDSWHGFVVGRHY